MCKNGFILVEVLMGLLLLGLIIMTCFPILNTSLYNLQLSKQKMEMIYIAESTIEQLKSFNYNSNREDEYLFDTQLIYIMERLMEQDPITINLPQNIDNQQWKYICTIYKEEESPNFWKIRVSVSSINEGQRLNDVTIQAFMPILSREENEKNLQ